MKRKTHTVIQPTSIPIAVLALAVVSVPAAGALVHQYTFEGGTADDTIGGLNPSVVNAVGFDAADFVQGGFSAVFDGDEYIEFASASPAFAGTTFSVAMWVKPEAVGIGTLLANKPGGDDTDGFALLFTNNADLLNVTGNGSTHATAGTGTGLLLKNAWQHVAYTIDVTNAAAPTCRIYLDGVDRTDADTILSDFGRGAPWRLGMLTDGGAGLDGRLDDLRIYDEVLSEETVQFLANNPNGVIPEPVTTIGMLLGGAALTAYSRRRRKA